MCKEPGMWENSPFRLSCQFETDPVEYPVTVVAHFRTNEAQPLDLRSTKSGRKHTPSVLGKTNAFKSWEMRPERYRACPRWGIWNHKSVLVD